MSELIVVSCLPNHPSGHRNRAGYRFSTEPSVVSVDEDTRKRIKEDKHLVIHRRLSQAWFKAFGIDRTEKNEEKFAKNDPENWQETANCAPDLSTGMGGSQTDSNTQPGGTGGQQDGTDDDARQDHRPAVNGASSQKACVDALIALGKIPGTDFDPAANRNLLLAIYQEAFAAQKPAADAK